MADPKKPFSPVNIPAEARKPKGPRKKLTLSGALRRIELIMEDFSSDTKIKLAEYAMMHAKECATAKVMSAGLVSNAGMPPPGV